MLGPVIPSLLEDAPVNLLESVATAHAGELPLAWMAAMLDAVSENVLLLDPQGRIVYMNDASIEHLQAVAHMLLVPPEAVVGNGLEVFDVGMEHPRALVGSFARPAFELNVVPVQGLDGQKVGSVVTWEVSAEHRRAAFGVLHGIPARKKAA